MALCSVHNLPIGDQRESKIVVRIGKMVILKPLDPLSIADALASNTGTTMIVRRSGVTPLRNSNPGRTFPPTCLVIARFTIAIATSEAGTRPTIARTRSGHPAIPTYATAISMSATMIG